MRLDRQAVVTGGIFLILLRLIVAIGIIVLPFLALALLSGSAEGMIWMIFPVLFTIPALLGAVLVFAPLEWILNRQGMGHMKNTLVPLAGGLLTPAAFNLLGTVAGWNPGTQLLSRPTATFLSFGLLAALGAIWGCYWRLTEWAAERILRRRPIPARREPQMSGSE